MKYIESYKPKDGFNRNHRKESHFYKEVTLFVKHINGIRPLIIMRFYGTNSRIYCAVWVQGWAFGKNGSSGTGYAGGYGYCRESASAQDALEAAGFKFKKNVSGVGMRIVEDALAEIAKMHGKRWNFIHTSHA